jgi:hypothetical protein
MALSGDLGYFGLPEVLQVLSMGRNSGTLSVTGDRANGSISISTGRLMEAHAQQSGRSGEQDGEDAIFALLANTSGSFVFDVDATAGVGEPQAHTERRTSLTRGLDVLLLEAHWRHAKE